MSLLVRIKQLVNDKSQFIIATHSPILITFPNAQIYEIKTEGIYLKQYKETELYLLMKDFFQNTDRIISSILRWL